MSVEQESLKILNENLQQEKWTSTTLNNYSLAQIEKLDILVNQILKEETQEQAFEICKIFSEKSKEAKKSVTSLYIMGYLSLLKDSADDTIIIKLIELLLSHRKASLAEFIGEKAINFYPSKDLLKLLSKVYENTSQESKKIEIWEKLFKIDLEDTDSVRGLGLFYEAEGRSEESHEFFKKALNRFIEVRNFSGVREMWTKIITQSNDFDFFQNIEKKVFRVFDSNDFEGKEKKVILLLEDLYNVYANSERVDACLNIIKNMLAYSPNNMNYRKELVSLLRKKYRDNPNIESLISKSHLNTNSRNITEALEDFEKRIFFLKGNFVFHKTWNVGVIREVSAENLTIDFVKKRGHVLSTSMAMEVLESLDKGDIRVYKAVWTKEKLKEKLEKDLRWGIISVLKSHGTVSLKVLKSELYPSIFKENEWNTWSSRVKDFLEKDLYFVKSLDKSDHFVMRSQPISFEEKKYTEFKSTSDFFQKYKLFSEFIKDVPNSLNSEYILEMFSYFSSFIKTVTLDVETLASYLVVEKYQKEYTSLKITTLPSFQEFLRDPVEMGVIFEKLDSVDLKKECLDKIYSTSSQWEIYYSRIFPTGSAVLNKKICDLLKNEKPQFFKAFLKNIIDKSSEKKEAYFYIMQHYNDLSNLVKIPSEQRMLKLLDILGQINSEIMAKRDSSSNKKLQKGILGFFYEDGFLEKVLTNSKNTDLCRKVFEILKGFPTLSVKQLVETQNIIKKVDPSFVFEKSESSKLVEDETFYTLLSSFSEKQRELQHLKEVEIPQNSKDIGEAMALGDLKENAEYHAAKDRQSLLTSRLNTINLELDRAKVLNQNEIKGNVVSFGTKITVINNLKNKSQEVYSILGPWESQPEEGILSYKSPFAKQFLNAKKGERLKFSINDHSSDYTIKEIEILPLA